MQAASTQVGTPCIVLKARLGNLIQTYKTTANYVLVQIAMQPPILLCSLYLPPRSHHSDLFAQVVLSFEQDVEVFQKNCPGLFVLGGGDFNTQLAPQAGPTGRFVGSGERAWERERSDTILATLAHMNLKLPNTFASYGPTRRPWDGKQGRDTASTIDFLFCTESTVSLLWPERQAPGISSDHRPIGAGFLAPAQQNRKQRKRLFKNCFTDSRSNKRRLHAQKQPNGPLPTKSNSSKKFDGSNYNT